MTSPIAIAGGLLLATLAYLVFLYNQLVSLRNYQREAWSAVDVFLKRRADLIPNLVATVQGYSQHESRTLTEVIAARQRAAEAPPAKREQAEKEISGAMTQLIMLAEAYPELKADQQFSALQKELVDTEDHIELSRRYYNGTVRDYNNAIERFPALLFAGAMGFQAASFFTIDRATEGQAPSVNLDTDPS